MRPQEKRDTDRPDPIPQLKYSTGYNFDNSILNNPLYKDMKFLVLNIKHFQIDRKEELVDYVKDYNPQAVIIDWCYSKDGDVANVLTTSGQSVNHLCSPLSEMHSHLERTCMEHVCGKNNSWIHFCYNCYDSNISCCFSCDCCEDCCDDVCDDCDCC